MLKIGLENEQTVVTAQAQPGGCGCNKNSVVKITQDQKQMKLQALTDKINKTRNSIYKTKAPIF